MKQGFTLAEVLITLGIIGIIAAITMPILISGYRKQLVETRLAHFYSVINQALVRAQVDYEEMKYWENLAGSDVNLEEKYPKNKAWVEKYLCPYIQCHAIEQCKHHPHYTCVTLANGSMFDIGYDNLTFYPDKKYAEDRSKQFQGKNCFGFMFSPVNKNSPDAQNKGIEPYVGSWWGRREQLFNSDDYGCKFTTQNHCGANLNKYCTKLIQMNGWKVPKDYPFKF